MKSADFQRIALSLEGVEQGAHMGATDFRVDGKIFATLAHESQGFGNVKLSREQQTMFVQDQPEIFLPVHGGWGRMGMTHVRLAAASEDILFGALHAAWKLRKAGNAEKRRPAKRRPT